MTLVDSSYTQSAYILGTPALSKHNDCICGAPAQHLVYRVLWYHPGLPLREVASYLRLSYDSTKQAASRMRRQKDLVRRCPWCWEPTFFQLVCRKCGFDGRDHQAGPASMADFQSSSPVYRVQPNGSLGSFTAYQGGADAAGDWAPMRMHYGGRNIQHMVEKPKDARFERLRSRLWQGLKSKMPSDSVCEEAVGMLYREYSVALTYPGIKSWRGFSDAVLGRVWNRLRLMYPELPKELPMNFQAKKRKSDMVTPPKAEVDPLDPAFDESAE